MADALPAATTSTTKQDPQKAPAPLDNLQAMMNLVLISSGRFLKSQQAGPDAGRMQYTLKRAVHAASERFHDSLDEMDTEIRQAHMALRRDLAVLQADRKKREVAAREAEAEKARLAAESSAKQNAPATEPAPALESAPPPPPEPTASTEPAKPAEPAPEALARKDEPEPPPHVDTASKPAEDTSMSNADNPTTANDSEFDFDALFGDTMDTSGDADNNNNNNTDGMGMDMDASGPDLNFTLDESAPSLLPGLEDFAKGGPDEDTTNADQTNNDTNMDLDFAMPDLPDITATTATTTAEQPASTKPQEDSTAQLSTSNDDLNIDTMPTDSLDDLFNLDYENPVDTQFDDAFFGFGEN